MTDTLDYDPSDPYRTGPPRGCWERMPFRNHRSLRQVMLGYPVVLGPVELLAIAPGFRPGPDGDAA